MPADLKDAAKKKPPQKLKAIDGGRAASKKRPSHLRLVK